MIVLANFASALAVDLREHAVVARWAEQAPRKIWLTRPGDVLLTPVPLSEPFARYACALTGVPRDSVRIVTVRDRPGVAMADSVADTPGLTDELRALAAGRPGTRLLPIALDASTFALAAALGVPVSPCGRGGPAVGAEALAVTELCNTKAGFRAVAERTGMRVPYGRTCSGPDLRETVRAVLRAAGSGRGVVKPDRSAGGHGLRFVGADDPLVAADGLGVDGRGVAGPDGLGSDGLGVDGRGVDGFGPDGFGPDGFASEGFGSDSRWTVEEYVPHTVSISAQFVAAAGGPRPLFDGVMRTEDGSFTGYRAPLRGIVHPTVCDELRDWGMAFGRHLIAHGYRGPYDIDALVATDGTLYATESNVRRTATTTPYDLVVRLARGTPVTWTTGTVHASGPYSFTAALDRLRDRALDYDPERGDGVVLYADAPADGVSWRYAILARSARRLDELAASLPSALQD
ncbi:peptide ligase PGM1-related protein [Streptomyces sp. NPDC087422]|uniref:preATP grasp domain-containing protein n=1 Tax=Streptomyces sp. NPDC087422 TaxID=3365786 RepID=UPI0037FA101A